ncbi:ABC transporter ATP-binding protein [Roseovarius sp. MMSF_3281]|uniref:ABC transporter ATP-binding protein n=1 Tax=Roseovarius sp. MMSF_3281 TaxID=3046694 RepID=UPI00273F5C0D|nr:ABC transporter ATP-binding protein [Roseovarius sp. MMSF_3281]
MSLSCQSLGWSVRRQPIVQDITLDVQPGETLGLIGANGSGKSTLLKMLAGIRAPTAGRLTLDGRDLASYPQRQIAQRIAFVEQQAETGDRITVRDAVELGRTPWLSALRPWSDTDETIVARATAAVEMQGFEARQWATLSGGERQRVHIARALAQEPQILLLDEPTNHLDIHHQLSILSLVARLPVTSIVALHDLNQAMECDRLALLQRGRLVTLGPPEEVLTCERLAESFAVRASILTDPADGACVLRFHKPT